MSQGRARSPVSSLFKKIVFLIIEQNADKIREIYKYNGFILYCFKIAETDCHLSLKIRQIYLELPINLPSLLHNKLSLF